MSRVHRRRLRVSLQRAVQLASAALFNGYAMGFRKGRIFTGGSKAFCVPVLNCYSCPGALGACPIGALQTALGGSAVIHRPFCKYLCPLGAFYALFNRFSFFQMELDRDKCVGCGKCEAACPMGVEVTRDINSPECIRCGRCKTVCPTGAVASGFACGAKTSEPAGEKAP